MSNELDTFLAHYGILGMRWGVRKDNYSSGYIPTPSRRRKLANKVASGSKTVYKKATEKRYPEKARDLSDDELNSRVRRMEQEKKYKELASSKVQKGASTANKILGTSGIAIATTLVTAGGLLLAKKIIRKRGGMDTFNLMFPKK